MADTVSILSTNTHSSGVQTLQSQKVKGDAYFGQNDGLHTVMIQLSNFVGTIKIQSSALPYAFKASYAPAAAGSLSV